MKAILWVGLGGSLGAIARYLLGGWIAARLGASFPYGTFAINVAGSGVLGLILGAFESRVPPAPLPLAVTIGFLGAFTTFSTFTYETTRLIEAGSLLPAMVNVAASVIAGLIAVMVGLALGRAL